MALPTFDATRHHVGLGPYDPEAPPEGNVGSGFFIRGYNRSYLQQERQSVFGVGRDDLGDDSKLSRWNQDSFIGGAYQYRIGQDQERFAESSNLLPMLQDKGAISVPPLIRVAELDPLDEDFLDHLDGSVDVPTYVEPKRIFQVGGDIYVVFKHALFRWHYDDDDGWEWQCSNNETDYGSFLEIVDAKYDPNDGVIHVLRSGSAMGDDFAPTIARLATDFDPASGIDYYIPPNEQLQGFPAHGFELNTPSGEIIVACGLRLFAINPPQNPNSESAPQPKWREIGRLPGRWRDAMSFNGRLYILCNETDGETTLVAYDGQVILPVLSFPFEFEGWSMTQYGGRVFVAGRGTDVNGGDRYAELYEVTGASVRLVRTFQDEHYASYPTLNTPKNFKTIAAADGLLWMCHQGVSLIAYDITADGFWGASEIQTSGVNVTMHKLSRFRGGLYGYGSENGNNDYGGLYRVATPGDDSEINTYSSVMVTSDFDAEPSLEKKFGELVLRTRNQSSDVEIEYSVDSGITWEVLNVVTTSDGETNEHWADLSTLATTKKIRFRFTAFRGTITSYLVLEILSFSVSFTFVDTGKRQWSFTIVGADEIEVYDDLPTEESELYVQNDLFYNLVDWREQATTLRYDDFDGEWYLVTLKDLKVTMPVIAPREAGPPEAFYTVTLQEL
jgi:hypothetical protein